MEGDELGVDEGGIDGLRLGFGVGRDVRVAFDLIGAVVGPEVGDLVGRPNGCLDGCIDGCLDGCFDG